MTKEEKRLLISQAAKLTALGIKVEEERKKLRKLIKSGVPYYDPKAQQALKRFLDADEEWKLLEAEHLKLKEKFNIIY